MIERPTMSTTGACASDGPLRPLTCSFLLGAAIGAGLGILLAPASGRDLRAGLAAGAGRGRERAAEALDRGRAAADRARVLVDDERDRVSRAVSEGREAMADIRARSERALQTIAQEAAGAVADVKAAGREVRANLAGSRGEAELPKGDRLMV